MTKDPEDFNIEEEIDLTRLDEYEDFYDEEINKKNIKYNQYNEFNGKKPYWRSERLKAKKIKYDQFDPN